VTASDPGGAIAPSGQLALSVGFNAARRLDNFVPGPNAGCVAALRAVVTGESGGHVYLTGPEGSGKTHLLHASCALAAAGGARVVYLPMVQRRALDAAVLSGMDSAVLVCVDDVDHAAGDGPWELALFNLYNEADAGGARMVFAGRRGPAAMALADLRSRLSAALVLQLLAPDDAQRRQVLRGRARELGFELGDDVLGYLLSRQPRALGHLTALVEDLDRYALAAQRRVTVALVREFLDASGR
jgi:DnaA family protein